MKIKAVCEKTGLTDRTVRYYIEEGLISPACTENYLGRKSFDFDEGDVVALTDIATLRGFDFSIEEIRAMLCDPHSSPAIIQSVKERIAADLLSGQKRGAALSSLQEQRFYTVSDLANALSKASESVPAEETARLSPTRGLIAVCRASALFLAVWLPILVSLAVLAVRLTKCSDPITQTLPLALMPLLWVPSLLMMNAPRLRVLRRRVGKRVLLSLCVAAIPLCAVLAYGSVRTCTHSWQELAVKREANCVAEGIALQGCSICRATATVTLPALPHTVVSDAAVEATCIGEGMTEGAHCADCQAVLVAQEILPKIEHAFEKTVVTPTCGREGYILLTCPCGYRVRTEVVAATEQHQFYKNGEAGYCCDVCSLAVCEFGNVDGTADVGNYHKLKYYITGPIDPKNEVERTLVIYGNGDMPSPQNMPYHPWRESTYLKEVRTVIVREGVTSIAEGAFAAIHPEDSWMGNPFRGVKCFLIQNDKLRVDPASESLSGITCTITYS
ncbi:MAG: MerR family transcriptional regulator [Clostridia bacterium]|nr:MerR family transcriptional regulator [Clostridia bacterium]